MMDRASIGHLNRALGPRILALLEDPSITDVYLNEPDRPGEDGTLWVVRQGEAPAPVGTMSPGEAMNLVAAVAGTLDTYVNRDAPYVEGELYGDGPRFEGIVPPHVLAPVFAIRVPASRVYPLAHYVAAGIMSETQAARIERAVLDRENIMVVGTTGSGKTTLLNAIGEAVNRLTPSHRMVLIEGTRELRFPLPNRVRIKTGPALDEQVALRRALRLIPDRIWVGEVRGPETLAMLMAWNTGHEGGACSLHSRIATPESALLRLEQMAALATDAPMRSVIGQTVGLVVCMSRDDKGRRRVSSIASVLGWDAAAGAYRTAPEA